MQRNAARRCEVYTKTEIVQRESRYWIQTTSIGFIFSLGVLVSFVVGTVIVYQILYTDIRDHLREYATLKAIGYNGQYLFKVVLQEAIILALMGYVPGLILALGLYELAFNATAGTLPMQMTLFASSSSSGPDGPHDVQPIGPNFCPQSHHRRPGAEVFA
jgi:putative ABC transport system permease protein